MNSQVFAQMLAVRYAYDRQPQIKTGMTLDPTVEAYSPGDVIMMSRPASMSQLQPGGGMSPEQIIRDNPVAVVDGRRPFMLGTSAWRTTSP